MAAVFNVYVEDEQRDKIERIAKQLRVNRSQVFRWLIDAIDEAVFVPSISIDGKDILRMKPGGIVADETQPAKPEPIAA